MADVIVIGAGVIGCSTALALARRRYSVLVIDRLPAAGYGSTSSSSAVIRPYYPTIEGTAFAYENHFRWRDWAAFLERAPGEDLADYVQCGCLLLETKENGFLSRAREILDSVGVRYERLGVGEVLQTLPGVDLASYAPPRRVDDPHFAMPNGRAIGGALLFREAGYIGDPQLAARNLQAAAEARGARFRFNHAVAAIRRTDGRIAGITLDSGEEIDAPLVVNAAGPHSAAVNALAGAGVDMTVTTRAMRTEVVHVAAPSGSFGEHGCVIVADEDVGVYTRPETGGDLLIGSLEPPCDPLPWSDPDESLLGPSEQWTNQLWRAAQRFPALPIPNQAKGIVALYDVSSDWSPIYDRSDVAGFYLAIGTSGNQFKNAPLAGEVMARLIDHHGIGPERSDPVPPLPLDVVGRHLDLRFFSRRRPVRTDGGASVIG